MTVHAVYTVRKGGQESRNCVTKLLMKNQQLGVALFQTTEYLAKFETR